MIDQTERTLGALQGAPLSYIEQLHVSASSICSNPASPLLTAPDPGDNRMMLLTKAACKMWSCPECSARQGRRWIARALKHINARLDRPWYLMTLTAPGNTDDFTRTPATTKKALAQGWRKLSLRARRAYGEFDYLRVWELHKDGCYHQHYITDLALPWYLYEVDDQGAETYRSFWLDDNLSDCGMGSVHDYHDIDNAGFVAGYIAKYTLKQAEPETARHWVKGSRRVECSRTWDALAPDESATAKEWAVVGKAQDLETIFWRHFEKGIGLKPIWLKRQITTDDFEHWDVIENLKGVLPGKLTFE